MLVTLDLQIGHSLLRADEAIEKNPPGELFRFIPSPDRRGKEALSQKRRLCRRWNPAAEGGADNAGERNHRQHGEKSSQR